MNNSNLKRTSGSPDELPNKPNLTKFYKYTIYVFFVVIIGEILRQSVIVIAPTGGIDYLTYERIENYFALGLAYYFILAGWLSYFKAITVNPHTHSRYGTLRFYVDIFILLLYYYLLTIISNQTYHYQMFVWIFPVIFASFLLWDWLRYREYKTVKREPKLAHVHRKNRILTTCLGLGLFIIQSIVYLYVIPYEELKLGGINVWNVLFINISLGIVIVYRWKTSEQVKGIRQLARTSK